MERMMPPFQPIRPPEAARAAKRRRSDLPFGSQFTPAQVQLPRLLHIITKNEGRPKTLVAEIRQEFFPYHGNKVAENTVLALRAYGILNEEMKLTEFGRQLAAVADSESNLYELLARHILLNLRGVELVLTVMDMHRMGMRITLETLRRELAKRGIFMPQGGTHISAMKGWLQKAGVFRVDRDYMVDEDRFRELVGMDVVDVIALQELPRELKAFVRALARVSPEGEPVPSNKVAELASELYGVKFPEKSLPKTISPLEEVGLIRLIKTTQGRGAKPYLVQPTEKMRTEVTTPLLEAMARTTGFPPSSLWYQPLETTLAELESHDRQVKGQALERLALYFCWLLDLEFRGWRRRGPETAGAEVDVLAEAARLVFSRWQIQCKNTRAVSLDDVAREVGVAIKLKPHIILVVTSGRVGSEARAYATDIMREISLNIAFLDGEDLRRIAEDPFAILDALRREARRAMEVKRIDVGPFVRDGG